MAIPKFTCTKCDAKFSPPDWFCKTGDRHEIEPKIYFSHAKSLRTYVSEERIVKLETGHEIKSPARYVDFVQGRYTTRDPEEQWALDRKTSEHALISEDEWKQVHYKKEDLQAEEIRSLKQRLEKYENPLLDQVKQTAGAAR